MDHIRIARVEKMSNLIVETLQKLLPQLTTNYKSFTQNDLEKIIGCEATNIFIAYDTDVENQIIGTYSLVIFSIPTGSIARIEDVIVDEKYRGRGIGREMMLHGINTAKEFGISKIELTTHTSRIAANKLYQSLGFRKIETNVYRYHMDAVRN